MAIDLFKSKIFKKEDLPKEVKEQKIRDFFQSKPASQNKKEETTEVLSPSEIGEIILQWKALEFKKNQWSQKKQLLIFFPLSAIVIYSLFTDNFIVAVTFILIISVGYLLINKEPRLLDFAITSKGVITGNEVFDYKNIHSFWIFYEPDFKILSLRIKKGVLPHIHIPLGDEDPVKIRETLIKFIPEIEQEPSMIDTIERIFRI